MAQKNEVVLIDDLDGGEADTTINFGYKNRFYEIDLSTENDKALHEALRPYIRKGRPIAPPSPRAEAAQIRKWAQENGYEVSERGRLHRSVIEAYRADHKG